MQPPQITLDSKLSRKSQFENVRVGEEMFFFDDTFRKIFRFNPVGALIWEKLDGRMTLAQLAGDLSGSLGADPETVSKDLRKFVEDLMASNLLHVEEAEQSEERACTPEKVMPTRGTMTRRDVLRRSVPLAIAVWTLPMFSATKATAAQNSLSEIYDWEKAIDSGEKNILDWQFYLEDRRRQTLAKERKNWTWFDYILEDLRILSGGEPRIKQVSPTAVLGIRG
jgi:hypothetical protein